jgi:hypothetical protein
MKRYLVLRLPSFMAEIHRVSIGAIPFWNIQEKQNLQDIKGKTLSRIIADTWYQR